MPRTTPFHPRTSALCTSYAWKEWSRYIAVSNFDRHSEREYYAVRQAAGLLDVTPLYKYEVTGPDAGRFLARLWTRDISRIGVGSVVYGVMVDEAGEALDDGTVARIGQDWFRMTSSEPWLHWLHRFSRGYDVTIVDSTDSIAALALQGPRARAILNPLIDGFDLDKMRYFKVRPLTFAGGVQVEVSRTGYTGDLGFEIWCKNADALTVWDAIIEEGQPHGIEPMGLDALDVLRIEAGYILQGVDYRSARGCVNDFQLSSPYEIGLGKTVDLERDEPFLGMARLERESQNPEWDIVGIELDWPELERMHHAEDTPPHLAPVACRIPVPLFDASGETQVGQVTSTVWSPTTKRYLGIAQVMTPYTALGTECRVEYTVDFWRTDVVCHVVERPAFDPERRRSTPGRGRPSSVGQASRLPSASSAGGTPAPHSDSGRPAP